MGRKAASDAQRQSPYGRRKDDSNIPEIAPGGGAKGARRQTGLGDGYVPTDGTPVADARPLRPLTLGGRAANHG